MQPGASHSPQRTLEQASMTVATGQQGRREVASACQRHHNRPSGCRCKQWRRSWGSQAAGCCRPTRTAASEFTLERFTLPVRMLARQRPRTAPAVPLCPRVPHPCDLRSGGRPSTLGHTLAVRLLNTRVRIRYLGYLGYDTLFTVFTRLLYSGSPRGMHIERGGV